MSMDVETVLERRRLRKQVGLWRGLAIVAAVVVLLAYAGLQARESGLFPNQQIARITVDGLIQDERKQLELIDDLAKNPNVRGVIVFVNSPGGTTTGGEGLYLALRDLAEKKPVAAQFGTVAASAAYITGLGTDYIVARGNTITGSVGVIMQWPDVSGLLNKLGIKYNQIKSGNLKAEPSVFGPAPEEAIQVTQSMIEEGQRWFVGLVEARRKVDVDTIPGLRQGRVYSGRLALEHKLVDAIGAQDEVVRWMETERNLPEGLQVVDWKPQDDLQWPFGQSAAWIWQLATGQSITLNEAAPTRLRMLTLDGLLSVWHPAEN